MKQEEKDKLSENYPAIFDAFKQVLANYGLADLNISAVEFDHIDEQPKAESVHGDGSHEKALFSAMVIHCPPGYRKSYRINPNTGEQIVICVPNG